MDETFHLQGFRQMWDEAAGQLNIRLHWVEAVCDEEIVKERLSIGKDRGNHILAGKGYQMYLLFKKAFEPIKVMKLWTRARTSCHRSKDCQGRFIRE